MCTVSASKPDGQRLGLGPTQNSCIIATNSAMYTILPYCLYHCEAEDTPFE